MLVEAMKVSYDKTADTLSMILQDHTPVAESDEDNPGVILDYDAGQSRFNRNPGRFHASD